MKNVKLWNCGIMKLWKYGNWRVSRLVSHAIMTLGVCIFAYFLTPTIAYCGEAAGFSVCAVGDSITEGGAEFVAHRVALENEFAELGWNVEWKGSHVKSDSGSSNLCEGFSGNSAEQIAAKYEIHAADIAADVLLLHAGHNYNGGDPNLTPAVMPVEDIVASATNAHARIIAAARAQNPDVIVLYAQVISSGGNREQKYAYITNGLNQAIATLGAQLNTPASPVVVVDMADGWNYATDCVSDCVHPNATGAAKMAAKWMTVLNAFVAAGKLPGHSLADGVWVDERAEMRSITGRWADAVAYGANGKATLYGNTFTPCNASTGNVVTVEFTAQLCEYIGDCAPDETAQAAVRLGQGGCFQVWTGEKLGVGSGGVGELGWVDVEAEGVTPVNGAEYTLRTTFDYTTNTYSVEVKCGDEWLPLKTTPNSSTPNSQLSTSSFPLAASANRIASVDFVGDTLFTSLLGNCMKAVKGFMVIFK